MPMNVSVTRTIKHPGPSLPPGEIIGYRKNFGDEIASALGPDIPNVRASLILILLHFFVLRVQARRGLARGLFTERETG